MKILISGGTGFIGQSVALHRQRLQDSICILSRDCHLKNRAGLISCMNYQELLKSGQYFDIIINLAGESLAGGLWTATRRHKIYHSRCDTTSLLVDFVQNSPQKPKLFISASAVGIYQSSLKSEFNEADPTATTGYLAQVCHSWEAAAKRVGQYQVPVALLRFGVVLGRSGGMLKSMLLPFKLGLGTTLAGGSCWLSWIHLADVLTAIDFIIANRLTGVFNLTAPNPVTNKEFSRSLAKSLKRPLLFNTPGWLLRLILGEMADSFLLQSQRVLPARLQESGYKFRFERLNKALADLLA